MASTKKVFVGSLFDFSDTGAVELLQSYSNDLEDPESAPFIFHDKNNALFTFTINHDDDHVVHQMISQIDTFTSFQSTRSHDPVESPLITPIDGTLMLDDTGDPRPVRPETKKLVDDEDESENDTVPEPDLEYWKPQCGNISILPIDIGRAIADQTGCILDPKLDDQRVILLNGNRASALQTLERLEGVMTLMAKHSPGVASRCDSNVLLFRRDPDTTIKFAKLDSTHPRFERIILAPGQEPLVQNILLVAEARVWQNNERVKPANLIPLNDAIGDRQRPCKLFDKFLMPTVGNVENRYPRNSSSNESSQASGNVRQPDPTGKFMPDKEIKRVAEWREGVEPDATADTEPSQPLPETVTAGGRQRVVVEESSDEDDTADTSKIEHIADPWEVKEKPLYDVSRAIDWEDWNVQGVEPKSTEADAEANVAAAGELDSDTDAKPLSGQATEFDQFKDPTPEPEDISSPRQFKGGNSGNNPYGLLDTASDQAEPDEQDTRGVKPSDSDVRQLNVSFQDDDDDNEPTSLLHKSKGAPALMKFSPSKYGVKKHMSKNKLGLSSRYPASSPSAGRGSRLDPVHAMPEPLDRTGLSPPTGPRYNRISGRAAGYGNGSQYQTSRKNDLIDVSSTDHQVPTLPPPGLDYRPVTEYNSTDVSKRPQRDSNDPAHQDRPSHKDNSQSSPSVSDHTGNLNNQLGYSPQLTIPRRNINFLRNQAAASLMKQMNQKDDRSAASASNSRALPPERIQWVDESRDRRYHNTMSQRMANPGKGKKKNNNANSKKGNHEAEVEARERRAKAIRDAYGDTAPAKLPERSVQSEPMSSKKYDLIKKNKLLAQLHQDVFLKNAICDAAEKLVKGLNPILEASRAFKGDVKVEVQFGQALVLKTNQIDEMRLYKPREWDGLFDSDSKSAPQTTFTNVLTENGTDVDRLLEMRAETGSAKLWLRNHPASLTILVEFLCLDKYGTEFVLTLDQNGEHKVRKSQATIGQVALHCPSRVWDACAIVVGAGSLLNLAEEVMTGVGQFTQSVYIPGNLSLAVVFYRLPGANVFTVRDVKIKRVSVHDCGDPDQPDLQLRMTEVKSLVHRSHGTDKKLFLSRELEYDNMISEGRLHYEVAVTHRKVEYFFGSNPSLQIGDLVPAASGGQAILSFEQSRALVATTMHMLERMDWIGSQNIGTYRRFMNAEASRRAAVADTLPPMNRKIAIPTGTTAPPTVAPSLYQNQQSRIGSIATNTATAAEPVLRAIPGVRANTRAELFEENGRFYYLGLGGARIPVVAQPDDNYRLEGMGPVVPGDSASQVGGTRHMNAPSNRKAPWDNDKPVGFW